MFGNAQRRCTAAVLTALTVATAVPARAQRGQTAGLAGLVRDATDAPLAGVVITVASPQQIGGPQTVRSDAEGQYRFAALLPGTYTLTASLQGFETLHRRGVELPAGLGLTLDLALTVAPVDTTVEVIGVVPAVDVRSSASPQLIERELLENLPIESRAVSAYIDLAPGIARGVALGGAAGANPISVDGTNATDPVQHEPQGAPVVQWLDSLQVVSVGANAEYGEYTTARLNAVTRSGTNRFSGLGEYWWTRSAWAKWNELLEWSNSDGQLGGPIARDRVWFFAGTEYYKNVYRVSAFASQPRTPDEPLADSRERKLIAKLTTAPATALRLEGYATRNTGDSINGNAGPRFKPEALALFSGGQDLQNLRLTWTLRDRTLVEAHYGRFHGLSGQGPTVASQRDGPPPHIDLATRVFSVNYPQIIYSARTVSSGQVAITRFVTGSTGAHEFKAGVEHERAGVQDDFRYPGNMRFLDRDGQPELVDFWNGAHYRPAHHRTSLFLRDNWQRGRLTLEPGVRMGFYDSTVPNPASAPYSNHSTSPRLGAAWDVSPDHRTVVRAHYGRYHDAMSTRFYEYLDRFADTTVIEARVLGPNQFEEVARFGGEVEANTVIDPGVKHSYVEEWLAGVEREIWPRLSIKAQYIRRNTRNTIGFIDTGSTWVPIAVVDPGPDGVSGTADDGGPLTIYVNPQSTEAHYVMTNPQGAWRHYDAVQLIGARRHANGWSAQLSYTWGRTVGSFDNENGSNAANTDVGNNGNFVNPNKTINTVGRTVFDRRHDVRAFGTYTIPFWGGVRASGIYQFTSGVPWARLVNSFDPRTQAEVRVEPIGTRELPATSGLDVRVEKTFPVRHGIVAGLYADVYNATNHLVASNINQYSGSAFSQITGYTAPRRFRLGLRATF